MRDLTARFGMGMWSSNTTENGVLFAMKRGRVIIAVRDDAIVGTLTLSTYKPWVLTTSPLGRVSRPPRVK